MEERHLFFGREEQTAEMLVRLRQHRFIAVVGASGSGKSSLIRAGLLPELHGGTLRVTGSAWRVAVMRPGGDPLNHLSKALCEAGLYADDAGEDLPLRLAVTLERSGLGLVEAARHAALPARTNLLVVVDQFEELFRYTQDTPAARDAATAFVRLLLEAARQAGQPIYVVLTMRSDFLGDCSRYRGLAEAINQSEYLVPRLNRDQWRRAIEGPVRVGGGTIASRLVQRLLNDVGEDPDQLPLLQHALMRTWAHWARSHADHRPLDLEDYEAVGCMDGALSRHADEAYQQLPDDRARDVATRVFKALTEKTRDARGTRRPTRLADLVEITGASLAEVTVVTEAFRQEGRAFLMPPGDVALKPDTVVDITHESLMRAWQRLNGWVEEEAVSVRIYRRLAETALLWKENKAGLFRDPDLQIAQLWREQNQPNAAWAGRYGPGYAAALEFLDASVQARQAVLAAEEAARQRELEQERAKAENERLRAQIRVREAQRRVWLVVGVAVLAFALAASWLAHRNARVAMSRKLAVRATGLLADDPELALILATNAWAVYPSPEAVTLVRKSLFALPLQLQVTNHGSPVVRTVFSPDGIGFVTADDAGNLAMTRNTATNGVWQRDACTTRVLEPALGSRVAALEFSRDAKFLLSAAGTQVQVWDALDGRLLGRLTNHIGPVNSAVFSPDGQRVLTASDDGTALLWEWRAPRQPAVRQLAVPAGRPKLAACSPGGRWFAVATDTNRSRLNLGPNHYQLQLWASGAQEPRRLHHTGDVRSLAFSEDDEFVATIGSEGGLDVRETASGSTGWMTGSSSRRHLAFVGRRLLTWGPREVMVFEMTSGGLERQRPKMQDVGRLLLYPDGIQAAALSPDGTMVLTAGLDGKVHLHLTSGEPVTEFIGHMAQVNAVGFSPDGRWLLTGSHDRRAILWENRAGLFLAAPGDQSVRLVAASPNGALALGPTTPPETNLLIRPPGLEASDTAPSPARYRAMKEIRAAALSADGRFLVVAEGDEVAMVDPNRPQSGVVWSEPLQAGVRCLAFGPETPPTRLAVGLEDGTVRLGKFDPAGQQPDLSQVWSSQWTNAIEQVGLSSDGRLMFALHYGNWITVWTLPGGRRAAAFTHEGEVRCAAFDTAGRFLALGLNSGAIWIWQLQPRSPVDRQVQHRGQVNHLAWSRDGRFLVTGSGDKTAIVWEMSSSSGHGGLAPIAVLTGHAEPVMYVAFAEDDQSVLTADLRGGLRRHRLGELLSPEPKRLIESAAYHVTRSLDGDERRVYLGER
jgi:WD40 repeat protein/energy-coupling factor transporter ATP-binding protein EcfA2